VIVSPTPWCPPALAETYYNKDSFTRLLVGVGTMITHSPLHRAGRAALPHPASTVGKNAQAHERIRMTNTGRWKPPLNHALQAVPHPVISLATTAQDRPPQESYRSAEGAQCWTVHGHSVISQVTQQDRTQSSRVAPHDSGPLWFAKPSTHETFIHNTLPVFNRRTEEL
jgi:hypothetical protein